MAIFSHPFNATQLMPAVTISVIKVMMALFSRHVYLRLCFLHDTSDPAAASSLGTEAATTVAVAAVLVVDSREMCGMVGKGVDGGMERLECAMEVWGNDEESSTSITIVLLHVILCRHVG